MKKNNMFRKLKKSKKGLDEDFTDTIIGSIFTALIFIGIFVYVYSSAGQTEEYFNKRVKQVEVDYMLINYIRTPVSEEKISVSDFLGKKDREELTGQGTLKYIDGFCQKKSTGGRISQDKEDGMLVVETNKLLNDFEKWNIAFFIKNGGSRAPFCTLSKGKIKIEEDLPQGQINLDIEDIVSATTITPSMSPYFNLNTIFRIGYTKPW